MTGWLPVNDIELPLRLATTLNALAAGRLGAPEAEERLRRDGRPHHVLDADALFGADAETVTLRRALAWMDPAIAPGGGAGTHRTPWALLLPAPGHPAGLRGPASLTAAALERGAVVVRHDGGAAWLCDEVGSGVQWTLLRAERIVPPDDPRQASRTLAAVMQDATRALSALDLSGERPETRAPMLGGVCPPASQVLLDRAWLLRAAADAGMDAAGDAVMSHEALQRERALRPLARAADDAISSAVSWPAFAMVE